MGHARAILALPTDEVEAKISQSGHGRAAQCSGSRTQWSEGRLKAKKCRKTKKKEKQAHIIDLERRLQSLLGTKVSINANKRSPRGRIIIDYYSLDEFERLTERMGLQQNESI